MTIQVYSRQGCSRCALTKKTMSDHGIEFEELMIGEDVDREEVLEKFPGAKALPIIAVDGQESSLVQIMADLK